MTEHADAIVAAIGGRRDVVLLAQSLAGFTAPLQPALLLPEVLDPAAWLQQRLWWADAAEPYTTLMFQGSVNSIVQSIP